MLIINKYVCNQKGENMKNIGFIVLIALIVGVSVQAKYTHQLDEIVGKVKVINHQKKSFELTDINGEKYNFIFSPTSKIEYRNNFFPDAIFADITKDGWIKVSYYSGEQINTANTVTIF